MFEDLNWKSAARRSAVVIAIYLGLLYLLSVAFPDSGFNMDSQGQVISLFVNAIIFFFIFTFVYAFVERSRNRRISEARKQKKPESRPKATRRQRTLAQRASQPQYEPQEDPPPTLTVGPPRGPRTTAGYRRTPGRRPRALPRP